MFELAIQRSSLHAFLPTDEQIKTWVNMVLPDDHLFEELTVVLVDEAESQALNERYRHKKGPTNVLSFPFTPPPGLESHSLGDIIICAPVVLTEAEQQNKPATAHFAHMVIHGLLHLLGYNHEHEEEAELMESMETTYLQQLGFDDPYRNDISLQEH